MALPLSQDLVRAVSEGSSMRQAAIVLDRGPAALGVMLVGLAVASVARGYAGFGFYAMLVTSWSLVGSPARAVAVALALEVTASVMQAVSIWRDVPWRRVGLLMAGAALGTPLGTYLLAVTDQRTLRLAGSHIEPASSSST